LAIFRRNIQLWFLEIITLTSYPSFYILFFVIVLGFTVCFYMLLRFGQDNSVLTEVFFFCDFSQSLQANSGMVPQLGHYCFLENPFKSIVYHPIIWHMFEIRFCNKGLPNLSHL
jgi:hypothetical protein